MRFRSRVAMSILAGSILSPAIAVQAHHSIANFWDATKTISITGTVTLVKLVNPHSEIIVEVMENGQPVKWTAFGIGITDLRRRGITSEMLINKRVTLEGNPPKAATGKGIFISAIVLENGQKLNIRDPTAFRGTPSGEKQ